MTGDPGGVFATGGAEPFLVSIRLETAAISLAVARAVPAIVL